jgi:hypothetical protein
VRKVEGADHLFRQHEKELEEIIVQWMAQHLSR